MKKFLIRTCLWVFCISANTTVIADVPADQVGEVRHLIAYVKNSGCIINRNGTDYAAEEGIDHIEKKYDYFRDNIKTTEDFIKYSASKSTMSGDYYMVTCPGKEMIRTQDWLLSELKRYRTVKE